MSGEGGMGAVHQAMLQTKIAEGGKGGVMALTEVVKIEGVSPTEQLLGGGIQGAGQGMGSGMGLLAGNFAESIGLKDLSATGAPSIIGEMQQVSQDLSSGSYVQIETAEAAIGMAQFGSDAYTESAHHGLGLFDAGVSGFQSADPGILCSPNATPALTMLSHGHGAALGG